MKNYRQLIKQLPSNTIVVSTGSFNPPTAKHELQFKLVEKLVEKHNAEHVVFVSESEDLPTDRKMHFLEMLFSDINFQPINEEDLKQEVLDLKSKYRNIIVVASEDKVPTFKKTLKEAYIISAGDIENPKMKTIVTKGDYSMFKYQMPTGMRDIDARRLMNEMRQTMGLELIKEEVKFSIDSLRDKYFKGEIYHIGDIVESAGEQYEIMDRGANYLVVVNKTGDLSRKWIKDVNLVESIKKSCWKGYKAVGLKTKNGRKVPNCVPEEVKEEVDSEICYKGYTTKNMHHCTELAKAFKLAAVNVQDPVAMLNAIKTTDVYLDLHNQYGDNPSIDQIKNWKYAHIKTKEALQKIDHFDAYQDQWLKDKETLDKMLAPHGLTEDIEIGKHSNQNIERSYKSYRDFMAANKIEPGFIKDTKYGPFAKEIEPNVSQQIDDLEPQWPRHPQTKVGSTLAVRDHLRRQKVQYATEEVEPVNEITQKLAGNYLAKVTKQQLAKHGMQPNMYDKLPKNRQKGVSNAFKRLQIDKEGKPVHHLVSKENHIKEEVDDKDTITFDIPLLIRVLEMTREDVKTDAALHKVVEKLIAIRNKGTLTMDDYKLVADLKEQYMPLSIGGEVGDQVIKKVKTLPPELAPKDDSKRLGGGHRDHTFAAFFEKSKKATKKEEDFEIGAKELMNYRLAKENK